MAGVEQHRQTCAEILLVVGRHQGIEQDQVGDLQVDRSERGLLRVDDGDLDVRQPPKGSLKCRGLRRVGLYSQDESHRFRPVRPRFTRRISQLEFFELPSHSVPIPCSEIQDHNSFLDSLLGNRNLKSVGAGFRCVFRPGAGVF